MALLMIIPARLMMPNVPKNDRGCPAVSRPEGMPTRIKGIVMKVNRVRLNELN